MVMHSFDTGDAETYGILGAVLLSHIRFWVQKNAANERHYYEGMYWTYNSVSAFTKLFPYATKDQIRRTLDKLEELGAIKTGSFNDNPYDRTRWFSCQYELANLPNEFGSNAKSLTDTDIKPDVKHQSATPPSLQKALLKKGHSFVDENFQPNDTCKLKASKLGVDIETEKEKFILHAKATGKTFVDWQAGFQTWLMNAKKWSVATHQQPEQVMKEY